MIMINCPNANFKNYIFKLHHENAELKKCFLEIKDILELPKYEPIEENSLEYYSFLSSVIKFKIKVLKERSSVIDPRSKQIQFKNLITAVDEYRKMQIGKYLNRRETECLYRIESLLNKMRIKK